MSRAALAAVLVALVCACATVPIPALAPREGQGEALSAAAEHFYAARTPKELRAAVDAARAAGPDSALFHELASRLAQLDGHEEEAADHLLAALTDLRDDAALLHLHTLMALDFGWARRPAVVALLRALSGGHPSLDVRALASHHLAGLLNQEGRFEERAEVLAAIPGRLAFSVVGTWDNDQGKGFDLELDAERRPGLLERYEGRFGQIGWRAGVPADPRGRTDLNALMTPARFSVAFAQAFVEAPADGVYALRLYTTDALKVWVDGALVFSASQLERGAWDGLVVPATLKQGRHLVLVKSAHKEGAWWLAARFAPLDAPFAAKTEDDVVGYHLRALPAGSARARAHRAAWMHVLAGGAISVRTAEAWARDAGDSLLARLSRVEALWYNQERGRTADALAALDAEVGDELALVKLRQLRFFQQQGLKAKARTRLLELVKVKPRLKDAWGQLADLYRAEGWTEDELATHSALSTHAYLSEDDDEDYARALLRFGKRQEAAEVYRGVLDRLPASGAALRPLADLELDAGELEEAEALFQRRLRAWPTDTGAWLQLAEVRRRRGEDDGALEALVEAEKLSPESAAPASKRGDLAYARGRVSEAVDSWRAALERNPDNDALANRVDFLAPEARGAWMADVPDEAALEKAVRAREGLKPLAGADAAWLLDQEVTLLNSDGSTSNVVTHVVHAFNAQGRDRVIRQSIPSGRLRVLHAYSVDEKGARSEASSERNKQIFFRAMQPGSTLVLQYRLDAAPKGFLARYYTEAWSFQGTSDQRADGTFVLWAPLGTVLNERRVGALVRTEDRRGDQLRFSWSAKGVAPLPYEPSMPPLSEVAINVALSSVPDWKTWLSWEQALLDGVFRDSPDVDALARRLGEGSPTPKEKLLRVHEFVMNEIRYQQDYETFIAGVKPHAAPMVLERRYGDCKDKAVLFITLARKLGLEAHFALVRTRDAGPVNVDVPSQQFNHAIVWVPEQPGVEAARFFDPTADLLDLEAVRTDDVGTRSLVFDPRTGTHAWRDIPFQPPSANTEVNALAVTLDAEGAAKGTLKAEGQGRLGATYRQMARNPVVLAQVFQRTIGTLVPGAAVSNVRATKVELRAPAVIELDVEAKNFARREGEALRVRVPSDASPRKLFALATRRHPLLLGAPTRTETTVEVTMPEGLVAQKLPATKTVDLPCMTLERTVAVEGRVVRAWQRFELKCERLSAAEYPRYRDAAEEMARLLDEELVLGPAAAVAAPAKVPGPKAGAPAR